jgi:hypothetical protein
VLRSQLIQSANTARKLDPQLAAIYHAQMTQQGASHRKALCVVAARLAERGWLTMARGEPYVICDLEGRPVTPSRPSGSSPSASPSPPRSAAGDALPSRRGRPLTKALKAQVKSQHEAGHEATFPTPA